MSEEDLTKFRLNSILVPLLVKILNFFFINLFHHIFISIACISDVQQKISYFTLTYCITITCIHRYVEKKLHLHMKLSWSLLSDASKIFLKFSTAIPVKKSNLNYSTQKKTHWKNPKIYPGVIFCYCSLHKVFTQPPCKKILAVFSECVNFLEVFTIKN